MPVPISHLFIELRHCYRVVVEYLFAFNGLGDIRQNYMLFLF